MIAKIKGISFTETKINVQVDYFYDIDEAGYDDCYREIKQVIDEVAVGTGEWRLYPFNSMGLGVSPDATKEDVVNTILSKLKNFQLTHSKLPNAQPWIGTEIEDK